MILSDVIATIVKVDTELRTANWQIEMMHKDIAALRRTILELAHIAEERGMNLVDLTKTSQDTIVQARLGGFAYEH